jgi:hypothetical protein
VRGMGLRARVCVWVYPVLQARSNDPEAARAAARGGGAGWAKVGAARLCVGLCLRPRSADPAAEPSVVAHQPPAASPPHAPTVHNSPTPHPSNVHLRDVVQYTGPPGRSQALAFSFSPGLGASPVTPSAAEPAIDPDLRQWFQRHKFDTCVGAASIVFPSCVPPPAYPCIPTLSSPAVVCMHFFVFSPAMWLVLAL